MRSEIIQNLSELMDKYINNQEIYCMIQELYVRISDNSFDENHEENEELNDGELRDFENLAAYFEEISTKVGKK